MIPDITIEEIRYRNNIEDVISSYVTLKRAGSNMVACCPFHSEKTPSFTVFTSSNSFYCFGCGAGGDVISFIMRAENLDYVSALRFLAARAGIEIPEDSSGGESGTAKRSRLISMNKDAAKFFFEELKKNDAAKNYLLGKRKLPEKLIRHFGLGYAPAGFGGLVNHLSSLGYSREEMNAGFLCGISKKNGKPFDMFRNRVMFPIIDVSGDIIAFGGRVMDDSLPKYLNSSDTPAFKKSRQLFALNFAKKHCSEQMILCEGYMDVIALHGAGFQNAVATLGTALTPEQARLMKRYTKSVAISYDSDEAGQRAANRAFGILGEAGLETRILKMEGAKDPDEYIKKFGTDAFKRVLQSGKTQFDFKFDNIIKKYNLENAEDRIKAAGETVMILSSIYSEVERDVYMRRAAQTLDVPYESLKADVKRNMARAAKNAKNEQKQIILRKTEGYGDRVNPERINNTGAYYAEEAIIGILAAYPETIPAVASLDPPLTADSFVTQFNRRVFEFMLSKGKDFSVGMMNECFTQDEIGKVTGMSVKRQLLSSNGLDDIKECMKKLKSSRDDGALTLEELIDKKRAKKV